MYLPYLLYSLSEIFESVPPLMIDPVLVYTVYTQSSCNYKQQTSELQIDLIMYLIDHQELEEMDLQQIERGLQKREEQRRGEERSSCC